MKPVFDVEGVVIDSDDLVRVSIVDEDGCCRTSMLATVIEVNPDTNAVFVTEAGNDGREGWTSAQYVTVVEG
jgi:hypothetical protein